MKTILIIEDFESEKKSYVKGFTKKEVTILWAYRLEQAEKLFEENPNPDIIVVDGCVDDHNTLDSIPLIQKIRKTYKGPMIAASSSDNYRKVMVKAGCDLETWKENVNSLLKQVLGI